MHALAAYYRQHAETYAHAARLYATLANAPNAPPANQEHWTRSARECHRMAQEMTARADRAPP